MTSKTLSLKDKGKTQSLQDVWLSILPPPFFFLIKTNKNQNKTRFKGSACNCRAGRLWRACGFPHPFLFSLLKTFGTIKSSIQRPNKTKQGNRVNTPTFRNIAWYKKNNLVLCHFGLSFDRMKANNRLCVPIYLITYSVEPNVRINKGNNKITELRTIFQRESQNS